MKKSNAYLYTLLLFCFLCSLNTQAQTRFSELGVGLGAANYNGDLVPGIVVLQETRPMFNAFAQTELLPHLNLRGAIMWAQISGSDVHSKNPSINLRNLSFRSTIFEGSLLAIVDVLNPHTNKIVPYLTGGIALFKFNPKAKYQNQWIALQPLGTEGQNLDNESARFYKLWETALPLGLGVRWQLDNGFTLGVEALQRKLFTDYLDDVSTQYHSYYDLAERRGDLAAALSDRSGEVNGTGIPIFANSNEQRGNPKNKDWYFTIGFTAAYRFETTKNSKKKNSCFGGF